MGIQQQPLQAKATYTAPPSFQQSVIALDPVGWHQLDPEQKNTVADAFFKTHYENNPEYKALSDPQKITIRTAFNKTNNVGQVKQGGLLNNINKGLRAFSLTAGSVLDPAGDAYTFGLINSAQDQEKLARRAFPGIETDPGLLGEAYRLHQNSNLKAIGGALGAARGTQGLQSLGRWAIPAYSAISNTVNVAKGNANPVQGLVQTGIDTATSYLPGGNTFWKKLMAQGAGGAVGGLASSAAGDVTTGHKVDWNRAIEEAIRQAWIGAGMGGGHHLAEHYTAPSAPPKRPKVTGLEKAQYIGTHAPGRPWNVRTPLAGQIETYRKAIQNTVDQTARHASVTEAQTLKDKISRLKKQYETLSQLANHPEAHATVRRNAAAWQAQILKAHDHLASQHRQEFGKGPAPEKQHLDHTGQDFKNVVAMVKKMRAEGNIKQANLMLNAFKPEAKARVFDEVHRQEQADKQAAAQQQKDQKAKAKAEKEQYEREFKKLLDEEKVAESRKKQLEAEAKKTADLKRKESIKAELDEHKRQAELRKQQGKALAADIRSRNDAMLKAHTEESRHLKAMEDAHKKQITEKYNQMMAEHKAAIEKQNQLNAEAQRTKDLKQKEAIRAEMAKNKEEGKKRSDELKRLRADIEDRSSEKTITGKVEKADKGNAKGTDTKPATAAQQAKQNREEISQTLQTLAQHHDWAEQPAIDFLKRHDIKFTKSKKGSVLSYNILVGRKGTVTFKYNASVRQLFRETGIPAIAAKLNKNSTLDSIKSELNGLAVDENVFTGGKNELTDKAYQAGIDEYQARDKEENAYYDRVDKNEAQVRHALENATTMDEVEHVYNQLESDRYADMPPEFFDSMVNEYIKHTERVANGEAPQKPGSAQPQGSAGENEAGAGAGQGQGKRPATAPTEKDLMPVAEMRNVQKEANSKGQSVRIRYWAERTGETGEFQNKVLHDVKIIEGKDGKETKWRGINADGQTHTYIERNNSGSLTDSNIISVEPTGQPNEFRRIIHPDTGDAAVQHISTGEIIPQIYKKGVKSSQLHANMASIVEAVNSGKHVPVDAILDAARDLNNRNHLEQHLESMSQEERAKLYEQSTGNPC